MTKDYPTITDTAPQLLEALRGIKDGLTVTETWPRKEPEGELILLSELTNNGTGTPCVDELAFQLDIWAETRTAVLELAAQSDGVMQGIGLRRTLAGPVTVYARSFRRTMRYGRRVDKRTMRLID